MFIYKALSFFVLISAHSFALPLLPDEINLPPGIKGRSLGQIQAIFSSLEKQYSQKTANLWRLKYHKALLVKKKDTKLFCLLMAELSSSPAFPLKSLALIQSYEICPFDFEPVFEISSTPEWLRLRLAEAFYKRRKIFKNPEQTLKATRYLGQHSPYKDLRVSYLKHALALAKKQDREIISQLLYKEAPRLQPRPQAEDYFLVAEDCRENREFKKAIDFYVRSLNAPDTDFETKDLSFKGLRRIYKIQKRNKKQIINSRQWSDWLLRENTEKSLSKYYERRLELSRQYWNRDENKKALQLITEILKDSKSRFIAEKAFYLRGLIYSQEKNFGLSLKDWDQAAQILLKNKGKRVQNPDLLAKILWKKAWLLIRQTNYKQALESLRLLERINKNPYTQYKILFWKGKTLQNLGQKYLARRSWRELIKKDHLGYYGLLARKALNKKPSFKTKLSQDFSPLGETKSAHLIHWLILFEETDLLSRFLDHKKNQIFNQKRKAEKEELKMIWLWSKAKRYLDFFQFVGTMDEKARNALVRDYALFLFPMEFSKEVEKASKRWRIPQAFLFALIRQESAFNIRARSRADAFGLMQLIPSTARQTARRSKISYRNYRDLYKPSKNILLGTAYLKSLLNRYSNNFVLSLSAYNAGSTALDKWREDLQSDDPLEFIENIPYEETRTYIRLLIRNYIFYHNRLKSPEEDWFPEWPLQPLPKVKSAGSSSSN